MFTPHCSHFVQITLVYLPLVCSDPSFKNIPRAFFLVCFTAVFITPSRFLLPSRFRPCVFDPHVLTSRVFTVGVCTLRVCTPLCVYPFVFHFVFHLCGFTLFGFALCGLSLCGFSLYGVSLCGFNPVRFYPLCVLLLMLFTPCVFYFSCFYWCFFTYLCLFTLFCFYPICKYSQFPQLTECSRQHISPTTSMTTRHQDNTIHKGLPLCGHITLPGCVWTLVGPGQYPRHTSAVKDGWPWVAQKHRRRLQAANMTQLLYMVAEPVL